MNINSVPYTHLETIVRQNSKLEWTPAGRHRQATLALETRFPAPLKNTVYTRGIFSTAADNQTTVLIQVFEVRALRYSSRPRGLPQIEVTFGINVNGIMKVAAADKGTGKSESITITNDKGHLSQEGVDRMVREAEELASEDEANRKRIEAIEWPLVWTCKLETTDSVLSHPPRESNY
ncbi:HSP70-domain-containing protein [Leucogyrophana mollusca]|uniref:HSP70-domain-containing protein n=1 Tax=Leucogyrophana mollusca TaxID=85980 RepID=A0ACB8BVJ7_9AGAM|nr:HSP70-domain-containing protein [Leucogyrophana mollusca]